MVSPKSTGEPVAALIEKISILLQEERALLEDENLDWDRLEENLAEIGELFKLLPLNGAGSVSYTHLDVYKRQHDHRCAGGLWY